MSTVEQKILSLFIPLPFSLKAKILAALSQLMANEVQESELTDDFVMTEELKNRITAIEERHAKGEGKTYTKEEFRKHLDNLISK
ncbi:MAG: hypothetical protein R3D00_23095 [Bacteroidia bacterium]